MIINGDCLVEMAKMEPSSIDFIVTDPPYGLKFMGKEWDCGVPGVPFWNEALRVCKPGSWLAAFGGTRTHHRLMCAIEDSGWEIRDCMMWLYGGGFPKSKGCLKPAWEPIILARKKGPNPSLNIEECRIEGVKRNAHSDGDHTGSNKIYSTIGQGYQRMDIKGRWPANLILDEEAGKMLDDQSGILKSGSGNRRPNGGGQMFNGFAPIEANFEASVGGASRFFYCAKASPKERSKDNNHPTVKPISLMKYILKLLAPPGNPILLDPFCGSGSTLLAAKELGIKYIGIEISKEYCEIAENRLRS